MSVRLWHTHTVGRRVGLLVMQTSYHRYDPIASSLPTWTMPETMFSAWKLQDESAVDLTMGRDRPLIKT